MPSSALAKLDTPGVSTTDQVFDALYRAVLTFELPPGARVSEAEIAGRLDVSRQPVRDAFFRLSKLGFLLIRPQRPTLITKISESAVRQSAFIRTAIEIACIRAATEHATDADFAAMEAMIERQGEAIRDRDSERFHAEDDAFHRRICAAAQEEHAWRLIQEQKAHMDRVRFLSLTFNRDEAWREHAAILQALRDRDPDAAEAGLRGHLGRIHVMLPQIRAAHSQHFEDET
ncbi:GntR family transcriptional regulator [Allosediminivita pacifica]|uniref:GntR family transcriptional regulator n=1 Tax=Allosediminivita pacifica TaxID=1267769 RepID=A0A2T6APY9_9RHOB|nr:GntR family transcriptional regulator [Allosediminivita pacifica]PTX45898.1 GntR family transcriptional regulator [Allosediminivita pacifica]GGB19264.1 GntR family transcriptional regulator [Allosediminivita pacifica]